MRKHPTTDPTSFSIHGYRAYLDDIEEVRDLLAQEGLTVTISSGGYDYESLGELVEHRGERPSGVTLKASDEDDSWREFSVEYGQTSVYVHNHRKNPSLFYKVRDRIAVLHTPRWPVYAVAVIGVIALALAAMGLLALLGAPGDVAPWVGVMVGPATVIIVGGRADRIGQGVYLRRRHSKGFIGRHWESIVVGVVIAFLSSVITLAVTRAGGAGASDAPSQTDIGRETAASPQTSPPQPPSAP